MNNIELRKEYTSNWEQYGFSYKFDITKYHEITLFAPPNTTEEVTNIDNNNFETYKVLWGQIFIEDHSFRLIDYLKALNNSQALKEQFCHRLVFDTKKGEKHGFINITFDNNKYNFEINNLDDKTNEVISSVGFKELFDNVCEGKMIVWAKICNRV